MSGPQPTNWFAAGVSAGCGLVIAGLVLRLMLSLGVTVPLIGWAPPIVLFLAGIGLAILAGYFRRRVAARRDLISPNSAIAVLAAARVAIFAGAFLAGAYLSYLLSFSRRLDAPSGRERFVQGCFAAPAGLVLMVAGIVLERACQSTDDAESGDPQPD